MYYKIQFFFSSYILTLNASHNTMTHFPFLCNAMHSLLPQTKNTLNKEFFFLFLFANELYMNIYNNKKFTIVFIHNGTVNSKIILGI